MSKFTLCCPCLFGLESVLSSEIRRLGGEDIVVTDGKVIFSGDETILVKSNIMLSTAERVLIVLGSFKATSFTELFDNTAELPFEDFIGKNDAFPVKGWSLNSALHSVPDCQAIIKKAAVRRLERVYGLSWFEETGPIHQIQFSIHKDNVMVMLDSSGYGLHKRGYRQLSNAAPIKETLAAGIIDLARVRENTTVFDPLCGSGTFLIESALHGLKIAPGLRRHFAAERWGLFDESVWEDVKQECFSNIRRDGKFMANGFDIDEECIDLTMENAGKAGVAARVKASQGDIKDFVPQGDNPVVICNPPYGERMLDIKQAEELYKVMGDVYSKDESIPWYIISPHEDFEKIFGKVADKRRKLYNGMIKCQVFMYFK
ncbi:MAG: class I SAM-dependent RNA methyltransferase [Oscillospiraceae bacterium]